ncbi:MAG: hypothetical protein ACAI25_14010 [Planctomycetota bacterium]
MRTSAFVASTLVAIACSAPGLARADELGSLRFDVPSGYEVYKRTATGVDMRGPKDAVISLRVNVAGSEAVAVARGVLPADAKTEVKEVAIQVAGRAGHLVVRRSTNRMFASAACIPAAGKAVAIVLGAPPDSYKESCTAWGAVVDNARFAEAAAPRPQSAPAPAPAPSPPLRTSTRAPAKHWIELRNVADYGVATVYFDGQEYKLGASAGQKLEATAGVHSFKWQNPDGSWGENRFEVPKFNLFKGSCPRPATAQPAPQPARDRDLSDEEYKEGARWFMNLACFAIYVVKTMDDWIFKVEDIHKDSVLDPIVKDMKAKPEFRDFVLSIPGFWADLCAKWKNGNEDLRYQIRRDGAIFLRNNSPESFPIPADDGRGGDEIDRFLRKERQAWDTIRAQRRQAQTTTLMTQQMMSNWLFNNTSNAMTFTPVHW